MLNIRPDIGDKSAIRKITHEYFLELQNSTLFSSFLESFSELDIRQYLEANRMFWESILFDTKYDYSDVLRLHMQLHRRYGLKSSHVRMSTKVFIHTIDKFFRGPMAEALKLRATSIGNLIVMQIESSEKARLMLNN